MNKRAKGRQHEKTIARLLEDAGWCAHLVQSAMGFNPKTKRFYARPQDIFGADIVAIKRWHSPMLIQVTADSSLGRKAKKFSIYPIPMPLIKVFIFQAKKRSGRWKYRVLALGQDNKVEEMSPANIPLEIWVRSKGEKEFRRIFL